MCGGSVRRLLAPLAVATVFAGNQVAQAPFVPPAVVKDLECPNCDHPVQAIFDWCPHCGVGLKVHLCAYCGETIDAGVPKCPHCGAPAKM